MNVSDFDYYLPDELIAQRPADKRDACRLLVIHRDTGLLEHRHFSDILEYLKPGDCLVFNDSRVIPARIFGTRRGTGAKVEFLLSKKIEVNIWETLVRPGRRCKTGDIIDFESGLSAEIKGYSEDGTRIAEFSCEGNFEETLEHIGSMPLPPYITRKSDESDRENYQNVYAKENGSVACATAGLHWTPELIRAAEAKGVKTAYVTLHVGIGTFRPVKVDKVEEHHMHFESYSVSPEAADIINKTKAEGGRIICVGTTACRTLESASSEDGVLHAGSADTGIFIYPGYSFKITDCMITNFHLPKSTLLMLVSALYDREKMLDAYRTAVAEKYRFFSYGDAMFIE
ncbi:MAG: tRNA preQ1(34) S-adenosylmethionine ribosyltransferase-isomerase QueA [Firmicutes bacterium]|nr:tRNA preQ1(34) S-adenosylmethionine ribosyltransferase-isomerase QueA [Bacillota bacterium]MBQ2311498.1 tRNA preQ1(34) S-adenosylmethionine ribosyltransferase-isomerase QueA [Bacillota bacterium]